VSDGNAAAPGGPGAAARAELNGSREIEVEGLTLSLPPELPFFALEHLGAEKVGGTEVIGFLREVLGDEQLAALRERRLGLSAGEQLVQDLVDLYGMDLGESAASPTS